MAMGGLERNVGNGRGPAVVGRTATIMEKSPDACIDSDGEPKVQMLGRSLFKLTSSFIMILPSICHPPLLEFVLTFLAQRFHIVS